MATGDIFLNHGRTTDHAPGDEIELPFEHGEWWKIEAVHQRVDEDYQSTTWLEITRGGERRLVDRDDHLKQYVMTKQE